MLAKKSLKIWGFCLVLTFFLGGCAASSLDLSFKIKQAPIQVKPLPVTLGVDKFVDLRPQRRGDDSKKWLGFIRGVWWLRIDSEIPELYTAFSIYNTRDLSFTLGEALADLLAKAHVAQKVLFLPPNPYEEVDYRLKGILKRSLVQETCYYYGSSVYAWLTRILGFPYVSYHVKLEMELRLRSMKTKKILWQKSYTGEMEKKYNNVYKIAKGEEGKHLIAYMFSKILERNAEDIVESIHRALAHDRS